MDAYVGFADLPNQIHRAALATTHDVTVMVAGEAGLGKSTFLNTLFRAPVYAAAEYSETGESVGVHARRALCVRWVTRRALQDGSRRRWPSATPSSCLRSAA